MFLKRTVPALVVLVFLVSGLAAAGWSEAWDQVNPPIPMAGLYGPGIGRCVALYEDTTFIGATINRSEIMSKSNRNRATYAIGTYNAVALAAHKAGRPDLAAAAVDLRMVEQPSLDIDDMQCWCENTIWSGDPRKGGTVIGCGGNCGSCTHCMVKSRKIN